MIKEHKLFISITIILLAIIGIILLYFNSLAKKKEEVKSLDSDDIKQIEVSDKENKSIIAINNVSLLYENNVPKLNISEETFILVNEKINDVSDIELKESLLKEVELIKDYLDANNIINNLIVNNVLISNYSNADIEYVKNLYNTFPDEWKKKLSYSLDLIDNQSNIINNALNSVKSLYSDKNLTKVKNNVTRSKYNKAKKAVDKVVQNDLKKKYNLYLAEVLKIIEDNEEKARKAEEERLKREAEIKAAWVVLETPYISQNKLEIFNGCEAASLLMGLQYKGYLKDISLYSFVDNMPKSEDNPHEGFVRDAYDREPRDLPHWIAPDALAKYGKSVSANNIVEDITGYTMDQLKKEIDNKNPVIVYVTGGKLDDPRDWIEEIPLNLHVVLLIGYNPITKQMVVNDPWTRSVDGKMYYFEERMTDIYNQVGQKAVVIR